MVFQIDLENGRCILETKLAVAGNFSHNVSLVKHVQCSVIDFQVNILK